MIRGVAAIAVVVFHLDDVLNMQLAPGGYLAVDLFFVLSGVVIAHAYEERLLKGMSVARFFVLRAVRFYPLYLVGLLMGAGLIALELLFSPPAGLTPTGWWIATLLGLFFLPALIDRDLYPQNVPAWSLFFELLVNILYACFARWFSTRVLLSVASGSLAVFFGFAMFHGTANLGAQGSDFPAGLSRTVFSFTVGMLIYRNREALQTRMRFTSFSVLACVVLIVPVDAAIRPFFDLACIVLVFPCAVALGIGESMRLERAGTVLGNLSYPIYAVHYPVIQVALAVSNRVTIPAPLLGATVLCGLIAGSIALHHFYDVPARRWLSRLTRRSAVVGPMAPSNSPA